MARLLGVAAVAFAGFAAAQPTGDGGHVSPALIDQVNAQVAKDSDRLVKIFKDIHQHPELGFMEVRTAGIVAKELKALGFKVHTGIGRP